jgi:polyhydroxyalkanoate synthesis regulator phasin
MTDAIRKSILFGIGAASLTKDKVEAFINELVSDNKLSVEEGKKLVQETLNNAKTYTDKHSGELQEIVNKTISDLNLATKDDIARLEKAIKDMIK